MAKEFDNKDLFSENTLKSFGKDYIKVLTRMLTKAGKKSSGSLINSLDYRLKDDAKEINIILDANDYLTYIDEGRKPGKYPNINAIAKWASLKGIPKVAVFPIARKIFKFGIKPTNVIDKSIKDIENTASKYEDDMVNNIENYIDYKYKQLK